MIRDHGLLDAKEVSSVLEHLNRSSVYMRLAISH